MTERSCEYKTFSKAAEETVWPAAGEEAISEGGASWSELQT